jgi:hypothetical protein
MTLADPSWPRPRTCCRPLRPPRTFTLLPLLAFLLYMTLEKIILWGVLGNSKNISPKISSGVKYMAYLVPSANYVGKVERIFVQVA